MRGLDELSSQSSNGLAASQPPNLGLDAGGGSFMQQPQQQPHVISKSERRQRRMMKNRDSAARSRARKQAYLLELEAENARLKEVKQELEQKLQAKKEFLEAGGNGKWLRRTLSDWSSPW